ncbi:hypothetical protein F4802DRAFT_601651 [Xylaria palmicola]|nr:hypothetical protein F4802DRAFT_601651 [Xylaria palmicola]
MQANLFKILAIAAAFSTVQSAPVETAEGQVTQGQVNGTQANEAHTNEAHTNEAHVDDGPEAVLVQTWKTQHEDPVLIRYLEEEEEEECINV